MTELVLSVPDPDSLLRLVEQQLAHGMVFLPDAGGVEPLTSCTLIVEHGGRRVSLSAEIVYVREEGAGRGVGLQLAPLDDATRARLRALTIPLELDATIPDFGPVPEPVPMPVPDAPPEAETPDPEPHGDEASSEDGADADDDEDDDAAAARAPQLHERMRSLSSAEQQRLALTGNPAERTMLERLYGPNVWEALIAGGRLSPPEVARIARKGTVPRPILESIGANGAWLASPLVQRALLSNPRCPAPLAQRVLSALPRRDLALVPQQAGYPMAVRQAAKVLLKR